MTFLQEMSYLAMSYTKAGRLVLIFMFFSKKRSPIFCNISSL